MSTASLQKMSRTSHSARSSRVDETLFGNTKPSESSRRPLATAGAVITASELQAIKASVSSTASRTGSVRRMSLDERNKRKEMMQAIDEERLRRKAESGEADDQLTSEVRAKIARAMPEHDMTKLVQSLAMRADALKGRQAQIAERRRREQLEAAREREWHRLSILDAKQRAELERREQELIKQQNKEEAEQLLAQIEERERERELEKERIETEGRLMLERLEQQKLEERRMRERQVEERKAVMADLSEANHKAIRAKQERLEKERRKDLAVIRYAAEAAEKQRLAEEEEMRQKAAREREIARLRSMQERASDEKAAADEARARQVQEEYELAVRARERRDREDAAQRQKEQMEVLAEQIANKERLRQKEKERDLALRSRLAYHEQLEAYQESLMEQTRRQRDHHHGEDVQAQIHQRIADRRAAIKQKYEERKVLLLERRLENEALEAMKQAALKELAAEHGLEPEWTVDIAKVRIA